MGVFVDPETVKSKSRIASIQAMDSEDVELLLIGPAERRLEEAFHLDLDTDAEPWHWVARFDADERLRTQFQRDMKAATILLIDRMEGNPHEYPQQTVRGSSVTFGKKIPTEVTALVRRWGKPPRLYRA